MICLKHERISILLIRFVRWLKKATFYCYLIIYLISQIEFHLYLIVGLYYDPIVCTCRIYSIYKMEFDILSHRYKIFIPTNFKQNFYVIIFINFMKNKSIIIITS